VSNFDRTRCLAGCEEILYHGPGVVGRQWWRVAFMGPLVGFWLKLAGACGRVDGIIETCKIATITLKIHPRPCGTRIKKQTNKHFSQESIASITSNGSIQEFFGLFFLTTSRRDVVLRLTYFPKHLPTYPPLPVFKLWGVFNFLGLPWVILG
jgi:hypothetical protein